MTRLPRHLQIKIILLLGVAILFAIPLAQEIREYYVKNLAVSVRQEKNQEEKLKGPTIPVYIGNSTLSVVVMSTNGAIQKGAGGLSGFGSRDGILFFFDEEGLYSFWMKDMQFSLDIIWIAADGTIVDIWQEASPNTYPHTYTPHAKAKYVLEVYAGFTQKNNLHRGDVVRFWKP